MPSKILHLSYAPATQRLLVSMAKREVAVYKLPELAAGTQAREVKRSNRESALKYPIGAVACTADGKGWASGSLEGKISVDYFDESPEAQKEKYAFRAHKAAIDGVDHAFPINAMAFHPL